MKSINKTQQGFTLVELIIVIVILGILAVTAAPRFLNFQGDAKASVLEGVAGSLKSGLKIVEGKAIIAGLNTAALSCYDTASNNVVAPTGTPAACGTNTVALNFGAPALAVNSITAIAEFTGDIQVALDPGTPADTTATPPVAAVPGTRVFVANNTADLTDANCRVEYTPASSTAVASVVVNNTGCN
jgi:prepilin-type N-terminal cleavage/methylation domain-containing protein